MQDAMQQEEIEDTPEIEKSEPAGLHESATSSAESAGPAAAESPAAVLPIAQNEPPRPQSKGLRAWGIIKWILLGLLAVTAGFLGYRVYSLTGELTNTQQKLAALQGEYDQLKAENGDLSSELEQTKAQLEETQSELTTTTNELANVQDRAERQQARITQASKLMDVVEAIFVDTENQHGVEKKVRATKDERLIKLYEQMGAKKDLLSMFGFLFYLFETISGTLDGTLPLPQSPSV